MCCYRKTVWYDAPWHKVVTVTTRHNVKKKKMQMFYFPQEFKVTSADPSLLSWHECISSFAPHTCLSVDFWSQNNHMHSADICSGKLRHNSSIFWQYQLFLLYGLGSYFFFHPLTTVCLRQPSGTLPLLPQQLASWLISDQDCDDEAEDRCSGHSMWLCPRCKERTSEKHVNQTICME